MSNSKLEIKEEVEQNRKKWLFRIGPVVIVLFIFVVMFITVFMLARTCNDQKGIIQDLRDQIVHLQVSIDKEPVIDVTYVGNKLESISELAVAKMTYNGIIHFEEGNIPGITKKEGHSA